MNKAKILQYVYSFNEGASDMKNLLGGKGANLAQMSRDGLPVPPGFIITTEACLEYLSRGSSFMDELWKDIYSSMKALERESGKFFGSAENPLFVSVRSGAPVSMPGMMDTILNLGFNKASLDSLISLTGDSRFAWDSYRRFIQMYGNVVKGVDLSLFEEILKDARAKKAVAFDYELKVESLQELVSSYLSIYEGETGEPFPDDPWLQLKMAVQAVFNSWNTPRAITYRGKNGIPDNMGTAVNIMAMVFGNMGNDSGSGVCFSRNPANGDSKLYGEYLINAQGEDVVSGIRTPEPISKLSGRMPSIYKELDGFASSLEDRFYDMQDVEFTVERGKLYILQTRTGKRSASAAVKIAVDMVEEKKISKSTAVGRVSPDQMEQLLHSQISPETEVAVLATGLPASPGAATGRIVFDPDEAVKWSERGESVLLLRPETTPDDIHGLYAASGIITSRGGMTSHAAVVARGLGKPCVSGVEDMFIDSKGKRMSFGERQYQEGDVLSIDGSTGNIIDGEVSLSPPVISDELKTILSWADEISTLQVWANADTPEDARRALSFGAKGIGLCRTEHMFMTEGRFPVVQEMVLADSTEERLLALDKLRVMQVEDFIGIFEAMDGLPVIIRLLDPPLHEFLPRSSDLDESIQEGIKSGEDVSVLKKIRAKVEALREVNPMMGFRGCRLGIVYPEIYSMQIRAIFDAMKALRDRELRVEIMMPLVQTEKEMSLLREMVDSVSEEYGDDFRPDCPVGSMIELPRAALRAGDIAREASFFSFGTNDLTQTCLGFSRDDVEARFMREYVEKKIISLSPFHVLDRDGVGELMRIAIERGKIVRPDMSIGICGEHGGDPSSIAFCRSIGLDYVSCSPFRVPVARIAAAWAELGLLK